MSISTSYDNEWTILATNCNASVETLSNTKGSFLGNGKLGFVTSFTDLGVQKSIITVDFDVNDYGSYQNNVVEGFNPTTLRFFDNKVIDSTVASSFVSSELNMYNGIVRNTFQVSESLSSNVIDVSFDIYAVRHLPYCSVQTVSVIPSSNIATLDLYHQVSCGTNIDSVEYNNNVIVNDLVNSGKGLYMLTGKGMIKGVQKTLAISSCYMFENSNNIAPIGFNVYAKDTNTCFQKIRYSGLVAGSTYKFHIVSAQMSQYDFKMPTEETKRILVNVMNKLDSDAAILKLRQSHVKAWADMWKSNISIEAKTSILPEEQTDINLIKRMVRYSLYNIWSAVREGIRTEINPTALSVIDANGTLFWDGDLWFIPVLTLFRPDIARNMLESRHRLIDKAIQLAAGYGYKGSKFPYVNDVVGYGNQPYWDVNGPLHIFNTALVTINIWNYYRISLDKDWLQNKGYNIMKNNANFFMSKVEIDNDGTYHIRDVYSFHDKVSNDNALTNYLVKTALKYTIEASYELVITPVEDWLRGYFNIDAPMYPSSGDPQWIEVFKLDEDSTTTDKFKFLEHLVPILPFYSEVFFKQNISRDRAVIERNFLAYENSLETGFEDYPMNQIIATWLKGSLMCCDSRVNNPSYDYATETYPGVFETALKKLGTDCIKGIWGNFHMTNQTNQYSDLSLNAMFILMMLTTVGTLRITGSVSETRFYSESFGIRSAPTMNMPKTWKNVKITGLGSGTDNLIITNEVYYE